MDLTIKEKEEQIYAVMVDKLYDYFVLNKREAKIESVIQVLSVLRVSASDKKVDKKSEDLEEVDLL